MYIPAVSDNKSANLSLNKKCIISNFKSWQFYMLNIFY